VRGLVLVGSLAAGIAAYLSVRFLTRYFATRTLTPFAIYSLAFGTAMIAYTTLSAHALRLAPHTTPAAPPLSAAVTSHITHQTRRDRAVRG